MLTGCENNDFEILAHVVEELLGEGADIEDHFKGQALELFLRWLPLVLSLELLSQLAEVVLLLLACREHLLVLDVGVNQGFVQVKYQGIFHLRRRQYRSILRLIVYVNGLNLD